LEGSGQVFGGIVGTSASTGLVIDTLNPDACSVTTVCFQVGLGAYGGVGMSGGASFSLEELSSGPVDSFGLFGNVGAFGASAGGVIPPFLTEVKSRGFVVSC
jgi:hypothetical protein